MFVRRTWTDAELAEAVAVSKSLTDALRQLGLRPAGGNFKSIRTHIARLGLDTSHFDPWAAAQAALRPTPKPLEEILVAGSTYGTNALKHRLYAVGLKRPRCEICEQGDTWLGRPMALILDHINGVHDDHRLENLRIVCPNCNATLDTHCGRRTRLLREARSCLRCGAEFQPKYEKHRYCSRKCGMSAGPRNHGPIPATRRVERPPYEQLLAEIAATSYSAVGRKYGVSDNAVRKWERFYERERARPDEELAA